MIEVEQTVAYSEEAVKKLTEGAEFVKEKTNNDVYYDHEDCRLLSKNIWLRNRNGRFELKIPVGETEEHVSDLYKEIENDEEIAAHFGWNLAHGDLASLIEREGFVPFADYSVTRQEYKQGEFVIDVDRTSFGFNMIDVELLVESEEDVPEAVKKIETYLTGHEIEMSRFSYGKVAEYLRMYDQKRLQVMLSAGYIK